jgi:hypothetical protein
LCAGSRLRIFGKPAPVGSAAAAELWRYTAMASNDVRCRASPSVLERLRDARLQVESMDEPLRNARSESAGISPEVAVRLQRLGFERVTNLMC